ncbi:SAF domain-containing protein [Gordonia sp. CPCC 205333]|uniref:SAF domain-containing protein n=1 Tax=Gordonia sp. CPCC 205333 TaxID=3140790 RepID=UPI003AF3D669
MQFDSLSGRLAPRWADRVAAWLRPGWARAVIVRRAVAIGLVAIATVVTVADHRAAQGQSVVAAAHDLLPGRVLAASDLTIRRIAGTNLPDGALRLSADGVGRTVTGAVRAGEIVTDVRLLSSRLPAALRGIRDSRLVPVRLADDAVADLLREGDVVDVLDETSELLARDAVVALGVARRSSGITGNSTGIRPILLAMSGRDAHRVATAGLKTALTVVLH